MIVSGIDAEDLDTLAQILEREHVSHRRKCGVCFAMFLLAFSALVVALVLVGVRLAIAVSSPLGSEALGLQFALFQVLAPLESMAKTNGLRGVRVHLEGGGTSMTIDPIENVNRTHGVSLATAVVLGLDSMVRDGVLAYDLKISVETGVVRR